MASEQIGILTILALLLLNAFAIYRKVRIHRILHIALVFFILGYLALYFSPGHAKRATHPAFDGFYMTMGEILALDFVAFLKRIYMAVSNFKNRILFVFSAILALVLLARFAKINVKNIALFVFGVALVLVLNKNMRFFWVLFLTANFVVLAILAWREERESCVFKVCFALFLAFCLCALSTIQFPGLPYRARLGDSLILIAAICILWDRFAQNRILQKCIIALCAFYAIFVGFCYIEYRIKWQNMVAFIEAQKARGVREIEVENIFHSRYKNFMNWGNPSKNANEWPNPTYAQYFGVEKFSVK